MRLFNGLIAILIVMILFLGVNICHVNATVFDGVFLQREENFTKLNNSRCNEVINQTLIDFYKSKGGMPDSIPDLYLKNLIMLRNYRRYNYKYDVVQTCVCKGYVLSDRTYNQCVPRCPLSCRKGTCKEPNVCTCNDGYSMSSDEVCVPNCANGCINGTCIDPEVCSCNEGYYMDSDGFTCRPSCNDECERNYGYCSEPNVCTCRFGYRKIGNDSSPFACEPICNDECINGHCVAPDLCKCAYGYERNYEIRSSFYCMPKCDPPCVLGTCTKPGTCTCYNNYRAVNASVCEPICSEPCVMGTCVVPETCSCNEGYKHRNGSKYICEPINCETDCGNGTYTTPRLYTCDKGFVYDETNRTCKPHCSKPCNQNEECTSPETCTCSKGYRKNDLIQIFKQTRPFWRNFKTMSPCLPICNFNCIGGRCTAPDVCSCYEQHYPTWIRFHHLLNNNELRICVPLPGPPCNEDSFCGNNGICHKSGICICKDGYAKDTNDDCVPFCAQACSNGTCTAPNRCTCHDGFASRNESFCEPICERGCQNGDCIGPNRCICHDNFVSNIDHHSGPECIPICTRNCSEHGECVIDRGIDYKCKCYLGWTGQDCDQPTMCVITMPYDRDNVNRITIHNNSTIIQVHESAPYCKCNKSVDNKTLCFIMQSNESNTTFIGCLLDTDLPCYPTPRYNASINDTKIVWPFVTIAMLLATGLTATAYLIYRKHQKKKLAIGQSTKLFVRESFSIEFLLPDNENFERDSHEE